MQFLDGRLVPVVEDVDQALAERLGLEDAAVEQNGGRLRQLLLAALGRSPLDQDLGIAGEELGQVFADGRVGGIGQTKLLQAGGALALRLRIGRAFREETLDENLFDIAPGQVGLDGAADDLAAAAEDRDRSAVRLLVLKQLFLGQPATVPEHVHLAEVELGPLGGQGGGHVMGQGQVHVVPAQKNVIADRDPGQNQLPCLLADGDQGQVGGSAADVAYQDHIAHLDLVAPLVVAGMNPGIEGRLRFFQERDSFQARSPGRFHRQLPRHGIERRRHGQDDVLVFQPVGRHVLGNKVVPGVGQVLQVIGAGFQGRDPAGILRRLPGQDRLAAINARMTKPRFGRRHQPGGHLAAEVARELADRVIPFGRPGHAQASRRLFIRPRQIQKGWQQRPFFHHAQLHNLGNGKMGQHRFAPGAGIHVGQGAIGGPQIDADHITRWGHCPLRNDELGGEGATTRQGHSVLGTQYSVLGVRAQYHSPLHHSPINSWDPRPPATMRPRRFHFLP